MNEIYNYLNAGGTQLIIKPKISSLNIVKEFNPVNVLLKYLLTIINGTGSGTYNGNNIIQIIANAPATNYVFDNWSGSTAYLSTNTSTANITMPNSNISLTANYRINYTTIKYGYLYNWYAATDVRNIASSGWHLPSNTERSTLITYLGGSSVAGGKLKETGLLNWLSPNTGATNEYGFNARGAGIREESGIFNYFKNQGIYWTATTMATNTAYEMTTVYDSMLSETNHMNAKKGGESIRLLKDSTTLVNGQTGIYVGNDGKIYSTICIGTQEWVANNLVETKYGNGDYIHGYDGGVYAPISNANWSALTTDGMCCYNDDINNA